MIETLLQEIVITHIRKFLAYSCPYLLVSSHAALETFALFSLLPMLIDHFSCDRSILFSVFLIKK